jgi:hypothetical protein
LNDQAQQACIVWQHVCITHGGYNGDRCYQCYHTESVERERDALRASNTSETLRNRVLKTLAMDDLMAATRQAA